VVAGLVGETSVRSASGDVVLDRAGGTVRVRTASGDLDARQPMGAIRYESASGGLTVVDGSPTGLSARTVSGWLLVDLEPRTGGEYELATVSGKVTLRVAEEAGVRIDARSLSGRIDDAHDLDPVRRGPVGRAVAGAIGEAGADLIVRTVSGDIAVLRPVPA
jgi:DUF4097 and DUF4098 domain-containing protein YvlB